MAVSTRKIFTANEKCNAKKLNETIYRARILIVKPIDEV